MHGHYAQLSGEEREAEVVQLKQKFVQAEVEEVSCFNFNNPTSGLLSSERTAQCFDFSFHRKLYRPAAKQPCGRASVLPWKLRDRRAVTRTVML